MTHNAEKDAPTRERCPGSLRHPKGIATAITDGRKVGACPRCGSIRVLRVNGWVPVHTRVTPPGSGG